MRDEQQAPRIAFYAELASLLLHQYGAFNSPVWFNVGVPAECLGAMSDTLWHVDAETGEAAPTQDVYQHPQTSACFIQSVQDTMESIMALAGSEARLFKYGSGSGTNLSSLRSSRERLSGGGRPSGPVSFMRVYDAVAGVVQSGFQLLVVDP